MRFWLSLSTCSKDLEVGAFFLSPCKLDEVVADDWGVLGETGMLNSCGGGREITELAPMTGIYPSGGSLNGGWETVGLWFRNGIGRIGVVGFVSSMGCSRKAIFSGSFASSLGCVDVDEEI